MELHTIFILESKLLLYICLADLHIKAKDIQGPI
ncbi:hypothetical protein Phi19:3_gp057 [Cellulophaga phage phi19:3]|uniref:Uncharacterized protein n=2 Tax=Baltivirus TaxID=2946816 RepID=S0A1B1_9CAUD|nr:hypothetical protein Phi19:3_gp057 [Cellulophaga phage phi19:3]YP_008241251.1 hypothetical protein Phi18:3_gp058 [Cellulophaga phage phi18:3]AGO47461.1 hypothetical protein Phi19:3_gp057 [Cellulophaga phage phi19:3]AGO48570.1 hypothetical protein Phi18:3_gp058 [Cellulophaga phage phi18:3]